MKKRVLGALLLTVFNLANTASAAGNAVATVMQVGFVIQEACTVQVADGSRAAPAVTCAHDVPVRVVSAPSGVQAASSQTVASTDGWQIYF
jgi:hypothetical protein